MNIPQATYRVQFMPSFGFQALKKILTYIADLGISDIYASPIFKARKGSQHGYDVVDLNQLNPELGTEKDFDKLIKEIRKYRLGWVQDIIPNHMAYDSQNEMLMDVLANGQNSKYKDFFDVDWDHPHESIRGRILAPFLDKFYGECLEKGEIKLNYGQEGLTIKYHGHIFPVKIESYDKVFTHHLVRLRRFLGSEHPDFIKLLGVLYSIKNIPSGLDVNERYSQITFVKRMLWELYTQNTQIRQFIDDNIEAFNGKQDIPESFDLLDNLLCEQFLRLSFWKVGTEELNYRRFFNINELITMRMEDEKVFEDTHFLINKFIKEKKFTGLRIDHVDGLYDPAQYLKRLRQKSEELYIIVEKILELTEDIPSIWPVQGTTGYDFLNYLNGLFCSKKNESKFDKIYRKFANFQMSFLDLVHDKKRLIIDKEMTSDLDNLAYLMVRISSTSRYGNDFTLHGLKKALLEVLTLFPVYRTYINSNALDERNCLYIKEAINNAKEKLPDHIYELDFIENLLLLNFGDHVGKEERQQWLHFARRFQQFTGPLMAKGFEDTTLYVYNRLLSLNEVGGNPSKFGISHLEFHNFNKKRYKIWPHTINATSTHDTKRGEDVRARINVLSEIPEEWEKNVKVWSKLNRRKKLKVGSINLPDRNYEYFIYQTLVGSFPFEETEIPGFIERVKNYIIKAIREAKVHTTWIKPDTEYEAAFIYFVEEILKFSEQNVFLSEFLPFHKKVAHYGIFNSVSQTLIKITSPGVPDFYQGSELWDLSLVDPDNRRPVDYNKRKLFLLDIKYKTEKNILDLIDELFVTKEDGRIKLFTIYMALMARKKYEEVFRSGSYIPLEVGGKYKEHIIAFARNYKNRWAVTIASRFLCSLINEREYPLGLHVWNNTYINLPENVAVWKNIFTNEDIHEQKSLKIGVALKHFPVALIISQ